MNINWKEEHVILIYSSVQKVNGEWLFAKVKNDSYLQTVFIYSVQKLFFLGWEWKRKAAKGTRIIIDFTKNSAVVM